MNSPLPSPDLDAARADALMRFLATCAFPRGVRGHAYVVGGAVRNFVLGIPPKDIDVVVDSVALGGYDAAAYARDLVQGIPVETHLVTNQYGVAILTVKGEWELQGLPMRGETIEIATARKESYGGVEGKGYKPHMVEPASIREDLVRREFTFNTLLWRVADLARGPVGAEILDLTGTGLRDLQERKLNTPRDPDTTFGDDPTRMLRAIKFSAKYGFRIPPEISDSIRRNAPALKQMPWDAVAKIFLKDILGLPGAGESLSLMDSLGLIGVLREMVGGSDPFRAFLTSEFRDGDVCLLLEMARFGIAGGTPIQRFSLQERERVREVVSSMARDDANQFWKALVRPPLDSVRVIEEHSLAPRDRSVLGPLSRRLILEEPGLAFDPARLTEAVARAVPRVLSLSS